MKICYIGCVHSSVVLLKTLINNGKDIVGVVTQNSSNYNSDFESLIPLCREWNIPFVCVDQVEKEEIKVFIQNCMPDTIYCFGWSRLIEEQILTLPVMGSVGFHPAQLPYNRGRHPLIWALALGLKDTASTFFQMTAEADAGNIISQENVEITYEDDAQSLYQKVLDIASKQVLEFTDYAERYGKFPFVRANEGGNIWRKRDKLDGKIDWRMSSESIYNLIRSLTHPYIGAHFCDKEKEYKIWKAKVYQESVPDNLEPGKILRVNSGHDFVVKTGDGAIRILDCDEVVLKEGEYLR